MPKQLVNYSYKYRKTVSVPTNREPVVLIQEDCQRCIVTHNNVGYLEDTCDCGQYYQCKRVSTGWIAYHRKCPKCLLWNQDKLSCSIRTSPDCVDDPQTTTTTGNNSCKKLRKGSADETILLQDKHDLEYARCLRHHYTSRVPFSNDTSS